MIRVLVAEDQTLVRGALTALLELEGDISVVGQAGDGVQAVDLAVELKPDVALVDIEMPKQSGLDVVKILRQRVPDCKTLMVTTFARPGYLQRAMKAGARGYVLKDAQIETLTAAIRTVYTGGKVMDPGLMMEAWELDNPLSERELEVLRAAAEGQSTREMARVLCLSEGTVRNYLSEIISKLEVESRREAVKRAEDKGWL